MALSEALVRLDGRLDKESKSVEEEAWIWVIGIEFSLPKGLMSLFPLLPEL